MRGPQILRAGPVELVLDGLDLRDIRIGGHEVVQQVFMAVRSFGWDTVPGRVQDLVVTTTGDSFEVRATSHHAMGDEQLGWSAVISGDPTGEIRYVMDATSATGFRYERVGLNVLHGIRAWRGRAVRAWLAGRPVHEGRLPELVGPQELLGGRELGLFPPFDRLELDGPDGLIVELTFSGDELEMEDQRNYGDGSFKTYTTPLQRPGPFHLAPGGSLRQALTVRVGGGHEQDARTPTTDRRAVDDHEAVGIQRSVVRIGDTVVGHVPPLGLSHPAGASVPDAALLDRLAALCPDHVRVEHIVGEGDPGDVLAARGLAATLGVGTIVELRVPEAGAVTEEVLRAVLDPAPEDGRFAPIDHLLIDVPGIEPIDGEPTSGLLDHARLIVADGGGATRVGVARDSLADVLRAPIDGQVVGSLSYAHSPSVHRSDARTLVENLAGIADEVRSARAALGTGSLLLGPVSMATRHGPYPDGPTRADGLPPSADPREAGLLGAAWLTGCLAELARTDVDAVTIATTVGPTGVVGGAAGRAVAGSAAGGATPDRVVSPAWHLLADLAVSLDADVLDVAVEGTASVLALRTVTGLVVWAAVYGPGETELVIEGLDVQADTAVAHVRLFDDTTLETATHDPDAARGATRVVPTDAGRLTLRLRDVAIARIEVPSIGEREHA